MNFNWTVLHDRFRSLVASIDAEEPSDFDVKQFARARQVLLSMLHGKVDAIDELDRHDGFRSRIGSFVERLEQLDSLEKWAAIWGRLPGLRQQSIGQMRNLLAEIKDYGGIVSPQSRTAEFGPKAPNSKKPFHSDPLVCIVHQMILEQGLEGKQGKQLPAIINCLREHGGEKKTEAELKLQAKAIQETRRKRIAYLKTKAPKGA